MNELRYAASEPLMKNRYVIKVTGTFIPNFLFSEYKIFNEGDDLIFTTKFYEMVNFCFNPKDFFDITGFEIQYLDPTGVVVNSLSFNVKGSNFEREQSYLEDGLQINSLRFIIDKESLKLLNKNLWTPESLKK